MELRSAEKGAVDLGRHYKAAVRNAGTVLETLQRVRAENQASLGASNQKTR